MATKSTKVTKGSLKSATGRGTSNTPDGKGKAVTVSAKAREVKTALKAVSAGATGLKTASAKAVETDSAIKPSSKKLLGASAKAISAAGGIECDPKYQHNLGANSGSIKVKVGGSSNLSTAQSVKGKGK